MLKGQAQGLYAPEEFERLVAPHVKSFDYFIGEGMETAVRLLEPLEVGAPSTWQQCRPAAVGGGSSSSSSCGGSSGPCHAATLTLPVPFIATVCRSSTL